MLQFIFEPVPGVLEDEGSTTLLKLLNEVDLKAIVSGEGPFTVFAPTNAAFEKLDPNLVSTLNQVTKSCLHARFLLAILHWNSL